MSIDLGSRYLILNVDGGVATCTIDRPDRRNAMTASMYVGMRRAVQIVNGSPNLHALVITGVGDVFCPGGELGGEHEDTSIGMDAAAAFGNDIAPFEAIRRSRKPVIAMVNGICQGGGLLMTLVSDLAVVSDRAVFRVPEVIRGVADPNYAAYLPAHVGVARARDLIFTARRFDAAEALAMGMIARVVPHEELAAATHDAVTEVLRGAPEARWQMKRIMNDRYGAVDTMTLDASIAGAEVMEGFSAFVERRAPSWIPEGYAPDGRL
ncbi:MAG: enoyl-CoA hydratase/isomerase family protein [Acidimicrobiia bacterium]|nr:enoyl-CoA hydratase/isomerase family protein [Acidimicrobiia bacterium]